MKKSIIRLALLSALFLSATAGISTSKSMADPVPVPDCPWSWCGAGIR